MSEEQQPTIAITPEKAQAAMQAHANTLTQQRNFALDEVAKLAGELAVRDLEIAALRKELIEVHRKQLAAPQATNGQSHIDMPHVSVENPG